MKVWWCEEHDAQQTAIEPLAEGIRGACWKKHTFAKYLGTPCRMVEMQLVPADARVVSGEAIVIEKENGEWPEIVRATIFDHLVLWTNGDKWQDYVAVELLDALASAQDGEEAEPPKDPWDYDP